MSKPLVSSSSTGGVRCVVGLDLFGGVGGLGGLVVALGGLRGNSSSHLRPVNPKRQLQL